MEENRKPSKAKIGIGLGVIGVVIVGFIALYFFRSTTPDIFTIGVARWDGNLPFGRSVEGFKEGLAENGFMEGKKVRFIIENPEANLDKQRQIIQSFINFKVDLIYSLTTPGTIVAKEMTGKMENPIPVVFSICTYPVESNLIDSLESSGNNLVGTRNYVSPSKQYYSFERIYPDTKILAVVHRKGESNSTKQLKDVKAILEPRGIKIVDISAVDLDDIRTQLAANIDTVDAIFSTCDTLTHAGGEEIIVEFSKQHKKPAFACNKEGVLKGALVGNVGDFKAIGKISGEKAALILKGSKPTWIKTESPREDYLIVNQKTANEIGITIPQEILELAKEVITQ